jgi:hypothetical protein
MRRPDDNARVFEPLAADLLSQTSPIYGAMIGGGFLVGVYAHAAKMPRLLALSIAVVMLGALLLAIGAQSADEFDRVPGLR